MAVKKAVQCGNVEDAIEKVNDLNPEVGCHFLKLLVIFIKSVILYYWWKYYCSFFPFDKILYHSFSLKICHVILIVALQFE